MRAWLRGRRRTDRSEAPVEAEGSADARPAAGGASFPVARPTLAEALVLALAPRPPRIRPDLGEHRAD